MGARCNSCRCCQSDAVAQLYASWQKSTGRMAPLHSLLFQVALLLLLLLALNIASLVINVQRALNALANPASSIGVRHSVAPPTGCALSMY